MEKHQLEDSSFGDKSAVFERETSLSPDQKVSFADFRKQKARDQVSQIQSTAFWKSLIQDTLSCNDPWISMGS
jgi:hypothetical protein